MTFSEILLQERKRRGLSQEELAGMVNVSRQAVSKWETGDAMPDLNKLLALADALDISLDELCGRETKAPRLTHQQLPRKGAAFRCPCFVSFFSLLLLSLFSCCCL